MKKTLIAGFTALTLILPAASFAQQPEHERGWKREHHLPSPADLKALTDARIAALKAGLALTPDQEKNWPAVEQAIRDMAKAREARIAQWREQREKGQPKDAIAVLRARADAMAQRAADLRKLADASEPLYRSLSDEQKHRLRLLMRMMRHRGGRHHGWRHHG